MSKTGAGGGGASAVAQELRLSSLSLVLLAFNEGGEIVRAVREAARYGREHAERWEVIVVDDGSLDDTAARVEALAVELPEVVLVRHRRNLGMGAGLRSGFSAAGMDYLAPFPADRQVRPEVLDDFLPLLAPDTAVVGYYETPHSGGIRVPISAAFALARRVVGGLHVRFDGTYCFHRSWLAAVDMRRCRSQSFVFSYELLDALQAVGCRIVHRPVVSHRRESGSSRVANPRRIARVFVELCRSRARRLIVR